LGIRSGRPSLFSLTCIAKAINRIQVDHTTLNYDLRFPMTRSFLHLFVASFCLIPSLASAENFIVQRTKIQDRKAVIATVEPVREIAARARIGGTISSLAVREGDFVKAGDRLAAVVDEKLGLQMQGLEERIQAQRSQRDQARLDYERALGLQKSGVGSQARLDQAKTALDVAERTLKAVESEGKVIGQTSEEGGVLAPESGRILKVPVTVGSVVMPGETVSTIARDGYILRLQLPERHAKTLKTGDQILVGTRGLSAETADTQEKLRTGKVKLVYPQIEQGRVIADVEVPEMGDYFVGERTRVYVSTGEREAIVIPSSFLMRRHGVYYARLKGGTDIVVQPGAATPDGVEILSGLTSGDELVKP
jgi:multidrug efflux system membrane fusion protein